MAAAPLRGLRALGVLLGLCGTVGAKYVTGRAAFSSSVTEVPVTKFSFSPAAANGAHLSKIRGNFHTASGSYFRDHRRHNLNLVLIPDDKWEDYLRLKSKGSLCRDRLQGLRVWWKAIRPEEGPLPKSGAEDFHLVSNVAHHYQKSRYFYVLMADCSLEDYDAKNLPPLEYEIILMNGKSHLPADELGLGAFHLTCAIVTAILLLIAGYAAYRQHHRHGEIHLTAVLLCLALGMEYLAESLEFLHITVYSYNGKGLRLRHTWIPADFAAEMAGFTSETIVTVLLLCIASGYTLLMPGKAEDADFDALEGGGSSEAGVSNKQPEGAEVGAMRDGALLKSLGLDEDAMDKLPPKSRSMVRGLGKAYARLEQSLAIPHPDDVILQRFCIGLVLVQLGLEYASRSYQNDFHSFHEHDHWPGLVLMLLRAGFAGMCWVGASRTLADPRLHPSAKRLLSLFRIASVAWFLAFPILVAFSEVAVSIFRQHYVVVVGCTAVQTAALAALVFAFLDPVGAMAPAVSEKLKDLGLGDMKIKEGSATLGFSEASSVGRFHRQGSGETGLRSRRPRQTHVAMD